MSAEPFVLNVNDDAATRYVITRLLEQAGFLVREAASGREALEIVRERPRLVVLDVQLPDMDGLEVCRRIKADPATSDIPVLQTSATYVTADRKVLGLESGADGYLAQPVEATELVATVRALLRASQAEQTVRDAAVDWQRTFDAQAESVMLIDGEGRVLRSNAAARTLIGGAVIAGEPAARVLGPVLPQAAIDAVARVCRTGGREELEMQVAARWLRIVVDPINGQDGRVERVVLVVGDVTAAHQLVRRERERAEELAEENRRKDQYLAMLAHELRNPLNAIASAAALLERSDSLRAASQQHVAIINRQVRHLSRLVDDLLETSRLTRGRVQLHQEDVDLRGVVTAAIRTASPQIDARRQRLITRIPEADVPIHGDPLRLEQVFVNLLSNASKYSEPGTDIHVSCSVVGQPAPTVTVSVKDEGIGIPPQQLPRVFDVFMQVDESLARSLGGLGIGLTVARSLIELHDGTIEAASAGVGLGSEFRVRLPLLAHSLEPRAAGDGHGATAPSRSLSILVVEDNQESAELMKTLLEMWHHHVEVAGDGLAGVDAAQAFCPDVAMIDIGLPGIDGYRVAASLRASPATRQTYLVAITGYGKPEDRARALDAGFDYYIVKPVHFEELEQVLNDFSRTGAGRSPS